MPTKVSSPAPHRRAARARVPVHARRACLDLELLESRILLTAHGALPLEFGGARDDTVRVTDFLDAPSEVRLFEVRLQAGERVVAAVDTSAHGGGLDSYLRLFQDRGADLRPVAANDNTVGADARLVFQAPADAMYYVGVSSAANRDYDPAQPGPSAGSGRGLFDLTLTRTAAPRHPDLVVSAFQLAQTTAVWGDTLDIHYTVENRGAAAAAATDLALVWSPTNRFAVHAPAQATAPLPALAAGESLRGTLYVQLGAPGAPPPDLAEAASVYFGLQLGATPPRAATEGNDWAALQILTAVAPTQRPHSTLASAVGLPLNAQVADALALTGGSKFYRIELQQAGNVSARLASSDGAGTLALYDAGGRPIVQGRGAAERPAALTHGLLGSADGTTYYLEVAGTAGAFVLQTLFKPSASTLQQIDLDARPQVVVQGDFNGDGRPDLVSADGQRSDYYSARTVTTLLGNGDGTFRRAGSFDSLFSPSSLAAADFDGDGRLDLAATVSGEGGVAVLLGNGDGSFQAPQRNPTTGGGALAAADFNADGQLDLFVATSDLGVVHILPGRGDGTFAEPLVLTVPGVIASAAADLDADGYIDLALVHPQDNQVSILHGRGDGSFADPVALSIGQQPSALAIADYSGDGTLDLAVADFQGRQLTVLAQEGGWQATGSFAIGAQCLSVVSGDFNGDGLVDLAAVNGGSNSITLLRGLGAGAFRSLAPALPGVGPVTAVAADFNGDGNVDLAASNYFSAAVTVLLGNGDGTFPRASAPSPTGTDPNAVASADLNGDGRPDLVVANRYSGDVNVLLGQGDGTFHSAGTSAAGSTPTGLVVADFNGDGRPDVAVADNGYYYGPRAGPAGVTVLLGDGAGSFASSSFVPTTDLPGALSAGDFNGDGALDLAVAIRFNADYSDGSRLALLLGDGRGDFAAGADVEVAGQPVAVVAADLDGDGLDDLAVASAAAPNLTVLRQTAAGAFEAGNSMPLDEAPVTLVAADFNQDRRGDVAVITAAGALHVVLDAAGRPTLLRQALGYLVTAALAADFNGDALPDLATANHLDLATSALDDHVAVLLGDGRGTFAPANRLSMNGIPSALAAADLNRDGRVDLAVANPAAAEVAVLLGVGDARFVSPVLAPTLAIGTPLTADVSADGVPDALVLSQSGQLLFRRGKPSQPGTFAPPVVVNAEPRDAARDVALVATAAGAPLVAALSASGPHVLLYQAQASGDFTPVPGLALPAELLPARLASADLNGDGLGDLAIAAAVSNQVLVALQTAPGVFGPARAYDVGVNPSAVAFIDADSDRRLDIVAASRFSGQVSLLRNQGEGAFELEQRFRAGLGPYGLSAVAEAPAVRSLEGTAALLSGAFDAHAGADLIVLNAGTNHFSVLSGSGHGGFLDPHPALTFSTGAAAGAVVSAPFRPDSDINDLAVLSTEEGSIAIYHGDGHGGFRWVSSVAAGNQPTGLASADVTRPDGGGPDGVLDLLVGNAFGDLLILAGNRDGGFARYRRADRSLGMTLVTRPNADPVFYFSDQANDRLACAPAAGRAVTVSPTVYQDRSDGILAPGPQAVVTVADTQYLLVANSGGNEVLIYTLDGAGLPDPATRQSYFTGTDPISLTLTTADNDLNGDAVPDFVVANEGSNDVSIFLGALSADSRWGLTQRPRQNSGGLGPTSVVVADVTGPDGAGAPDGSPDLLVSNGQSDSVSVLPNRGGGFFINQRRADAPLLATGSNPRQLLLGNFDTAVGLDLVTVNALSNDVTLITNFQTRPVTRTFPSGGTLPLAAVARDVNRDGSTDLLIANTGNGVLELLQGGSAGFTVSADLVRAPGVAGSAGPLQGAFAFDDTGLLAHSALANLSDLVIVPVGDELDVYGSDLARETAILLGTFLPAPPPSFLPPSPGFPAGLEIAATETLATATAQTLLPLTTPVDPVTAFELPGLLPVLVPVASAPSSEPPAVPPTTTLVATLAGPTPQFAVNLPFALLVTPLAGSLGLFEGVPLLPELLALLTTLDTTSLFPMPASADGPEPALPARTSRPVPPASATTPTEILLLNLVGDEQNNVVPPGSEPASAPEPELNHEPPAPRRPPRPTDDAPPPESAAAAAELSPPAAWERPWFAALATCAASWHACGVAIRHASARPTRRNRRRADDS